MGHIATATETKPQDWRKAAAAKAWVTMRAKRAAQLGEIREVMAQTAEDVPVNDLDIVRLYLLNGCKKTNPNYAPGAPVTGWSHYLVISREGKEITLFHPWTITRFTIPVCSFRTSQAQADPSVTISKVAASISARIKLTSDVPQYVAKISAALAQKAAN